METLDGSALIRAARASVPAKADNLRGQPAGVPCFFRRTLINLGMETRLVGALTLGQRTSMGVGKSNGKRKNKTMHTKNT